MSKHPVIEGWKPGPRGMARFLPPQFANTDETGWTHCSWRVSGIGILWARFKIGKPTRWHLHPSELEEEGLSPQFVDIKPWDAEAILTGLTSARNEALAAMLRARGA